MFAFQECMFRAIQSPFLRLSLFIVYPEEARWFPTGSTSRFIDIHDCKRGNGHIIALQLQACSLSVSDQAGVGEIEGLSLCGGGFPEIAIWRR